MSENIIETIEKHLVDTERWAGVIVALRTKAGGSIVFTHGELRGLLNQIKDAVKKEKP